MLFNLLLVTLIIQRLIEIYIGNKNIKKHKENLVFPLDLSEKKQMLWLHSTWFLSCFLEYQWNGEIISPIMLTIVLLTLLICQVIRFQIIKIIGDFWTPFPIAFKNQKIIENGPYRFISHPNYFIVMIEIALVPILGKCFMTAFIFSIVNFLFLKRRIIIEEEALNQLENFGRYKMKKKIIFFILCLFSMNLSYAQNIKWEKDSYDDALKSHEYIKFTGRSRKLGLISTSFDGYAKKFEINFKQKANKIYDVVLKIDAKKIDTDNSSRDEKMRDKCLEVKKNPIIMVIVNEIALDQEKQSISGIMKVHGEEVPLNLKLRKESDLTFSGSTKFKLSDAQIPDPSIAIASVDDEFEITFRLGIPR